MSFMSVLIGEFAGVFLLALGFIALSSNFMPEQQQIVKQLTGPGIQLVDAKLKESLHFETPPILNHEQLLTFIFLFDSIVGAHLIFGGRFFFLILLEGGHLGVRFYAALNSDPQKAVTFFGAPFGLVALRILAPIFF